MNLWVQRGRMWFI